AVHVKNGENAKVIEERLRKDGFEVDSRPPNVLRMTAHYGYTKFTHINRFVASLKKALDNTLEHEEAFYYRNRRLMTLAGFAAFGLFAVSRLFAGNSNTGGSPPRLTL